MKLRLILAILLTSLVFPGVVLAATQEEINFSELYEVKTYSQGVKVYSVPSAVLFTNPVTAAPTTQLQSQHPALSFATSEVVPEAGFEGKLDKLLAVKPIENVEGLLAETKDSSILSLFRQGKMGGPEGFLWRVWNGKLKPFFWSAWINMQYLLSELGSFGSSVAGGVANVVRPVLSQFMKLPTVLRNTIKAVLISIPFIVTGQWMFIHASNRAVFADASLSIIDLGLRVFGGAAAIIQAKLFGQKIAENYKANLRWFKEKLHRDVGDIRHDLLVAAVIGSVFTLVFGDAALLALAAKVPPSLVLGSQVVLSKVAQECTVYVNQCSTPQDLAFNFGGNVVGSTLSHATLKLAPQAEEAVSPIAKVLRQNGDEVVEVAEDVKDAITPEIKSKWYRSTLPSEEFSINYHWDKHALKYGKSIEEYTEDGLNFFQKYKTLGHQVILKDGSEGIHIKLQNIPEGGYFKPDGKVVTFWYEP